MLTLGKRTQAFETKCQRKLLRISYLEHKTNHWVWSKINSLVGPQEPLLATVKIRKFAWYGHVTRHDHLSKTMLNDTLRALNTGTCIAQGDLFYSASQHRKKLGEVLGKKMQVNGLEG